MNLDQFGRPLYNIEEAAKRAVEIITQHQPYGHRLTINEEIVVEILTEAIKRHENSRPNN